MYLSYIIYYIYVKKIYNLWRGTNYLENIININFDVKITKKTKSIKIYINIF